MRKRAGKVALESRVFLGQLRVRPQGVAEVDVAGEQRRIVGEVQVVPAIVE